MSGPLCCSGVGGIGCGEAQVSDRSAVCRALTREDFSTGSTGNLSQWPKTFTTVIGDNGPRGLFDTSFYEQLCIRCPSRPHQPFQGNPYLGSRRGLSGQNE
jgi:hypothetical protein